MEANQSCTESRPLPRCPRYLRLELGLGLGLGSNPDPNPNPNPEPNPNPNAVPAVPELELRVVEARAHALAQRAQGAAARLERELRREAGAVRVGLDPP